MKHCHTVNMHTLCANNSGDTPIRFGLRSMRYFGRSLGLLVMVSLGACKDLSSPLPAGIEDPGTYQTPETAIRMAKSARYAFMRQTYEKVVETGLMTDELQAGYYGAPAGEFRFGIYLDSRVVEGASNTQGTVTVSESQYLYQVRRQARLARHALATYAPDVPTSWQAEMLVYEALADIVLADMFCSGIPLSVVDFQGDYTYKPGSTTAEVYQAAVGLLDSAIVLSNDSVRIAHLARVVKGRALVALARYADADTTVAMIPNGYRFELPLVFEDATPWKSRWFELASLVNRDGGNGLPYLETRDPRIRYDSAGRNRFGYPQYTPVERARLLIGSALEARLIQAEAALQRTPSGEWLTILNALRTNGTFSVNPGNDTIWKGGTGGVDGLRALTDPALSPLPPGKTAFDVRLDLIFRERAFWLFLTGHRQGDLRRLVREYGRRIEVTYPIGAYVGGDGEYRTWIDIPLNDALNPLFTGCLNRETNE